MKKIEVECLSDATNSNVIRTPPRNYPALVIQGDSFSNLYAMAKIIEERTRNSEDEELRDAAEELLDDMKQRLKHYEAVLKEHGYDIPYSRPVTDEQD